MTEHRMSSSLYVWSYTSSPSLLSLDLRRLCGPIPTTLRCPLKQVLEGPKPIPRQEDIGQVGFDETQGDLDNT
jgi:hypothetical protein